MTKTRTISKILGTSIVAFAVLALMVPANMAHATLVGDDVTITLLNADAGLLKKYNIQSYKRNFNKKKFIEFLFLPIAILWFIFGCIHIGGNWVKAGFQQEIKNIDNTSAFHIRIDDSAKIVIWKTLAISVLVIGLALLLILLKKLPLH